MAANDLLRDVARPKDSGCPLYENSLSDLIRTRELNQRLSPLLTDPKADQNFIQWIIRPVLEL